MSPDKVIAIVSCFLAAVAVYVTGDAMMGALGWIIAGISFYD